MVLSAACARDRELPEITETKSSAATFVGTSPLAVPASVADGRVLVGASEWLEVGDRVEIGTASAPGEVTNVGSGILRIGSDAHVGSVWSSGPVDLRDRAAVHGNVKAGSTLAVGNGVVVSGSTSYGPLGSLEPVISSWPLFEAGSETVSLEPNTERHLQPGAYGALTVKSGSILHLSSGDYRFTTVHVEPNATLRVSTACRPIHFEVTEALYFRGQIVEASAGSGQGLVVAATGTATSHVEAPFQGALLAPNSELVINGGVHHARFFAKRLRLQASARVLHPVETAPPSECSGSSAPEQQPVVVSAGSPPTLAGPSDVPAFVEWYQRILRSDLPAVEATIGPVVGNASIVTALIAQFDAYRAAGDAPGAAMLIRLLAAFTTANAETFLTTLIDQPLPPEPSAVERLAESWSPFTRELTLRSEAILALSTKRSTTSEAFLRSYIQSRQSDTSRVGTSLRWDAIRGLAHGQNATYVDALRVTLSATDQLALLRPDLNDENFDERMTTYLLASGVAQ